MVVQRVAKTVVLDLHEHQVLTVPRVVVVVAGNVADVENVVEKVAEVVNDDKRDTK
jgi:hypothetical protein